MLNVFQKIKFANGALEKKLFWSMNTGGVLFMYVMGSIVVRQGL